MLILSFHWLLLLIRINAELSPPVQRCLVVAGTPVLLNFIRLS